MTCIAPYAVNHAHANRLYSCVTSLPAVVIVNAATTMAATLPANTPCRNENTHTFNNRHEQAADLGERSLDPGGGRSKTSHWHFPGIVISPQVTDFHGLVTVACLTARTLGTACG